jgi:hypothetical protein
MFNRRTNVALAGNVLHIGDVAEIEAENYL